MAWQREAFSDTMVAMSEPVVLEAANTEPPALGPTLQQIRKRQKLTLDDLAMASGVSRSMLSQIERGRANPTFATLWSLTQALGVDLSDLIGGSSAHTHKPIRVMTEAFTPEIRSEDGLCVLRILSPTGEAVPAEWYKLTVAPGGKLASSAHARGATEHLTVLAGTLRVTAGDEVVVLEEGATARYEADQYHAIENLGAVEARAFMVVES
ncbi:MAG: helix-turn-helix domain-containing protein [Asticcacaulis sp.]